MKKTGTLNVHLSQIIAQMGHGDRLVICDSGLPIPRGSEIVDLALTKNIPTFLDTVRVVLTELQVESAVIAEEIRKANGSKYRELTEMLSAVGVAQVEAIPHDNFKHRLCNGGTIAFVRTGEATPYANIILTAGVAFD